MGIIQFEETGDAILHPGKLTWNPNNGGLEDGLPFQLGDFSALFIRSSHSLPESKDPGNS